MLPRRHKSSTAARLSLPVSDIRVAAWNQRNVVILGQLETLVHPGFGKESGNAIDLTTRDLKKPSRPVSLRFLRFFAQFRGHQDHLHECSMISKLTQFIQAWGHICVCVCLCVCVCVSVCLSACLCACGGDRPPKLHDSARCQQLPHEASAPCRAIHNHTSSAT